MTDLSTSNYAGSNVQSNSTTYVNSASTVATQSSTSSEFSTFLSQVMDLMDAVVEIFRKLRNLIQDRSAAQRKNSYVMQDAKTEKQKEANSAERKAGLISSLTTMGGAVVGAGLGVTGIIKQPKVKSVTGSAEITANKNVTIDKKLSKDESSIKSSVSEIDTAKTQMNTDSAKQKELSKESQNVENKLMINGQDKSTTEMKKQIDENSVSSELEAKRLNKEVLDKEESKVIDEGNAGMASTLCSLGSQMLPKLGESAGKLAETTITQSEVNPAKIAADLIKNGREMNESDRTRTISNADEIARNAIKAQESSVNVSKELANSSMMK